MLGLFGRKRAAPSPDGVIRLGPRPKAPKADFVFVFGTDDSERVTVTHGVRVGSGAKVKPFALLSARGGDPNAPSAGSIGGISVRLPDEIEQRASGKTVRVAAALRSQSPAPTAFCLAYSTNEVGNSGWRRFMADDELSLYSFEYAVPPMRKGNSDFVGILPDPDGHDRAIEIAYVTVDVINP